MSAARRLSTPPRPRHLRLTGAPGHAPAPPWRFVARGALTTVVLGAIALLATMLLSAPY